QLLNGHKCSYLYSITRVDLNTIILHENIIEQEEQNHTSRNWIFSNNHKWVISGAEKNGLMLDKGSADIELSDAFSRLGNPDYKNRNSLDIPITNIRKGIISFDFAKRKINNLALLITASVLMCGFFTALIFNSFGYSRMSEIVNSLDRSIDSATDENKESIGELSRVIQDVQGELTALQDSVAQEKEAFFFSRQNTASNIRRMSDELPMKYYSRKKAYEFIAVRVESAATYGDLIYQVSRLPQNEEQAETLLATDINNVKTLDSYKMIFSNLVYPVRLDSRVNDGKSFMISSVFMEQRLNPIGTGGVRPHFAVDIININNIINITPENQIVRAPGHPGSIVSIAEGTIRDIHYDSVYGWNVEVEHIMTDEILDKYPDSLKWTSFYAHMNKPTGWEEGDEVRQNEKIGDIGEAGRSTGPHLHFEIRIYRHGGEESGEMGHYDKINPMIEKSDKLKE
ncbi:MAG: M23 family metallopeptidase, partial [Spirochaetaceae bacterium]|nr:M23 family metallopeptidase [Spirochaetaceae bacterium]